jgi:predicted GH43/DUF377 family glycosyl hydrolase
MTAKDPAEKPTNIADAALPPQTNHKRAWRRERQKPNKSGGAYKFLLRATFPWELVQVGNCGSPIETDAGWLVLSHGAGPMRKYCIGAFLLDRDDPAKVIGRLREPLLKPNQNEREGYVPNVVYTCGALLHKGELIIPYGLADHATGFATAPLGEVLGAME